METTVEGVSGPQISSSWGSELKDLCGLDDLNTEQIDKMFRLCRTSCIDIEHGIFVVPVWTSVLSKVLNWSGVKFGCVSGSIELFSLKAGLQTKCVYNTQLSVTGSAIGDVADVSLLFECDPNLAVPLFCKRHLSDQGHTRRSRCVPNHKDFVVVQSNTSDNQVAATCHSTDQIYVETEDTENLIQYMCTLLDQTDTRFATCENISTEGIFVHMHPSVASSCVTVHRNKRSQSAKSRSVMHVTGVTRYVRASDKREEYEEVDLVNVYGSIMESQSDASMCKSWHSCASLCVVETPYSAWTDLFTLSDSDSIRQELGCYPITNYWKVSSTAVTHKNGAFAPKYVFFCALDKALELSELDKDAFASDLYQKLCDCLDVTESSQKKTMLQTWSDLDMVYHKQSVNSTLSESHATWTNVYTCAAVGRPLTSKSARQRSILRSTKGLSLVTPDSCSSPSAEEIDTLCVLVKHMIRTNQHIASSKIQTNPHSTSYDRVCEQTGRFLDDSVESNAVPEHIKKYIQLKAEEFAAQMMVYFQRQFNSN
jgi:hypothetical protein